jgi:predicted  nucleic acid-binding Zn-ribbon protein
MISDKDFKQLMDDVSEIKSELKGSAEYNRKGLVHHISDTNTELQGLKKKVYKNQNDIEAMQTRAGAVGAGSGGVMYGVIEIIKQVFT